MKKSDRALVVPQTVEAALAVLGTALVVNLLSWLVVLIRLPSGELIEGIGVVAALVASAGFLLWMISRCQRWAVLVFTFMVAAAELPNLLDVVTGGFDHQVSAIDLIISAIEVVLCAAGLVLLWVSESRHWFFGRSDPLDTPSGTTPHPSRAHPGS